MSQSLTSSRSIQEFWIDFLLEEEFASDDRFSRAFAKACGFDDLSWTTDKVVHSSNDGFGEADLIVILVAAEHRIGLLIENKITASFQPQQAERYLARGKAGIAARLWTEFRTVLVAPELHLARRHAFQIALGLETIANWVCPDDPSRRAFKTARVKRAIEKKNATGVQIVHEAMTAFRRWYSSQIAERNCGFVPPVDRPAYRGDDWLEWTSEKLPTNCRFRHRTKTGVLDLSFAGISEQQLAPLRSLLPHTMSIGSIGTGKPRGALIAATGRITDVSDWPSAQPTVQRGLNLAEQMQDITLKNMTWLAGR